MRETLVAVISFVLFIIFGTVPAFAHVVVNPNQAPVASDQIFSVGVPVEKDSATIALRLIIPDGLKSVTPNVKPGWQITVKKAGDGDGAKVTEIDWIGGDIPNGEKDDFVFAAQVPAAETILNWKVYQTYSDGSVVSWDQDPKNIKGDDENGTSGPYSQTKVINDLASSSAPAVPSDSQAETSGKWPIVFSLVALLLSAIAVGLHFRKD